MYYLNPELAQKIVNYMMAVVPYNINIIDQNGIIIASGSAERIGQIHQAGLDAIRHQTLQTVSVGKDAMRPGVNLPFYYHNSVCGAVGISGPVEETIGFANIVKYTIELLISQEELLNIRQSDQLMRNQYLQEWVNHSTQPTSAFIARGRQLKINVTPNRVVGVLLLKTANPNLSVAASEFVLPYVPDLYTFPLTDEILVIIFSKTRPVEDQLQPLLARFPAAHVALGTEETLLFHSFQQAKSTLRLGPLLFPETLIYPYSRFVHLDAMVLGIRRLEMFDKPVASMSVLSALSDASLIETLLAYYRNDSHYSNTAAMLHIHRNSLYYRLDKIYQMTGLDPHSPFDLNRLIADYIIWVLQNRANNETDPIHL